MGASTARSGARQWSRTGCAATGTGVRGYRGELARRRSPRAGRWYSAHRLLRDRRPGEALDRPGAAGAAHLRGPRRVADDSVDALGERGGEGGRVARLAGAVVAGLDRHEQAGLAVDDDLDDAAGRRGHDRGLAGHRLEVDDPQRLVDRRAREDGRVAEDLDHVGLGQHLARSRTRCSRSACSSSTRRATSAPSSGVSGAPAHSTSCALGVERRAPPRAGARRPSGA